MSDTPRTDAAVSDGVFHPEDVRSALEFACTLERELAEVTRERDRFKDALEYITHSGLSARHITAYSKEILKPQPADAKPQPTHTFNGHPVTLVSNNGPLTGMVEIQRDDGSTEYVYPSELIPTP